MKIVTEIKVLSGQKEVADIKGLEMDGDFITVTDAQKVIETEKLLEKLTGYRFHIQVTVSA